MNLPWFCIKCQSIHPPTTFQYIIRGKVNGELSQLCTCDISEVDVPSDYGCLICEGFFQPEFSLALEFKNQNGRYILILCSRKCFKKCKKSHINDTSLKPALLCGVCKKEFPELKRCSQCKRTYYCSSECQKADWKSHKSVCSPIGLH